MVQIRAISTNTEAIYVADSTVRKLAASRVGVPIWPGSTSETVTVYGRKLSEIYIDGISTEAVNYIYYALTVGIA